MSGSQSVWIAEFQLAMKPPGTLFWHAIQHEAWPGRTRCGLPLGGNPGRGRCVAVRLDTADRIARPCPKCYPLEATR